MHGFPFSLQQMGICEFTRLQPSVGWHSWTGEILVHPLCSKCHHPICSKLQILTFTWGYCRTLICLLTVCFNTWFHSSVCRTSIQFFTIPIQWTIMDMSLFIQLRLWKGECSSVNIKGSYQLHYFLQPFWI